MSYYIINKNKQDSETGENYEVHNKDICNHLPLKGNQIDLGYFSNCKDAMNNAIAKYPKDKNAIDSCFYCCNSCHKE